MHPRLCFVIAVVGVLIAVSTGVSEQLVAIELRGNRSTSAVKATLK